MAVFSRAVSPFRSHPIVSVRPVGRPRIYEEPRVTSAVRLTRSMREKLRRVARERGVSVNELVVRTLSDYLEATSPEEQHSTHGAP